MEWAPYVNSNELDDVTALLGRILPDPNGFVERLLNQAIIRWGGASGPPDTPTEPIDVSYMQEPQPGQSESTTLLPRLVEMSTILAAALGACDCWGLQVDCPFCQGTGSSGWISPDLELFQELVGPAVTRLIKADIDDGPVTGDDPEPRRPTSSPVADTDCERSPDQHQPGQHRSARQGVTYEHDVA
jgi:hypothetical protein